MFGLQPIHLILIIIIALIIFGPSRLPELGRSLGKSITEFKDATREISEPAPARPPEDANRENRQDGSTESEPAQHA